MKKFTLILIGICLLFTSFAQKLNDHVEGQFLISFSQQVDIQRFEKKMETFESVKTSFKVKDQISEMMNVWLCTFDHNTVDEEGMLYFLRSQPDVNVAQYNHLIESRNTTPNDSLFNKQWQWENTAQAGGTADADVDAPEAWDITKGGLTPAGDTIVVAVIDDGSDFSHPDLKNNLWVNNKEIPNNNIDDDGNGYIDDYLGWNHSQKNGNVPQGNHGVLVAGMIGAQGNNGSGVSGINWNVKIMSISPFPSSADESTVIAAYSYAYKMRKIYNQTKGKKGAFVVATNLSWGKDLGQPKDAPIWCSFYDSLGTVGIISCGATSNNSKIDVDKQGDLPTACASNFLISVASSNSSDVNVSAFGQTTIDVNAPGSQIYSTATGGKYASANGTSFASPLVAGLVALAYSAPCGQLSKQTVKDPRGTALAIKQHIMESVDKKPSLTSINLTGGRVNAFSTLKSIATFCNACLVPDVVNKSIGKNGVKLDVSKPDSVTSINYRWRIVGTVPWKEVNSKPFTYAADSLQSCTDYEFQVQANCAKGVKSIWGQSYIYKTDGCCEIPTVAIPSATKNSLTVEFTTTPTVKSYEVRYRLSGATTYTTVTVAKSPFVISGLDSCALYEIQARAFCTPTEPTAWSPTSTIKTYGCGNCADFPYCKPSTFSSFSEWIRRVKFNTINKSSTSSTNGYITYINDKKAQLVTGETYLMTLVAGFSSPTFPSNVAFRVWIDYNQDGFFQTNELVVNPQKTFTKDTLFQNVTIPFDASIGNTRMRVGMKAVLGSGGLEFGPCDNSKNYGEYEDYCVDIVSGFTACKTPSVKYKIASGLTTVSWDTIPGAISYNIRTRKFGDMKWDDQSTIAGPYQIKGLPDCTKFEVEVRSICKNDISDFSPTKVVEFCTIASKETDKLMSNLNVYPVPFSQQLFADFTLLKESDVKIELLNTAGQVMLMKKMSNLDATRHKFEINDIENYPTGVYWLKISSETGSTSRKVLKVD